MHSRHIGALVAGMIVVVFCGSAVWLAGGFSQSAAPPPDDFEETLQGPLRSRDHSRRVDRLALTDTADALRTGVAEGVLVTNRKAPRIVLANTDQVGFPRRGTWTGPETVADFPFTELVPSWNVVTPKDTGVFFHVRMRDAKSRKRSPWLFVGRWGRTVNARPDERLPNDRITRFTHGAVRIDMPFVLLSRPADAYQVRATLQSFDLDPAVNPSVHRVAVAYSGVVSDPAERARLLSRDGPKHGEPATYRCRTSLSTTLPRPCASRSACPPA